MHEILALYNLYQILGPMVPKYVIAQHIGPCAWYYRSGHERDLHFLLLQSQHKKHCVEDLQQAQIVLQKLVEKQLESEQSKLKKELEMAYGIRSNDPSYQLYRVKRDIEVMHNDLADVLKAWKDEQLSAIRDFQNVQDITERRKRAIAYGYDIAHIEKKELESLSHQHKLNSLITILKQKDHIQSMSSYDFVTSREALGEKIQASPFPPGCISQPVFKSTI